MKVSKLIINLPSGTLCHVKSNPTCRHRLLKYDEFIENEPFILRLCLEMNYRARFEILFLPEILLATISYKNDFSSGLPR